MFNLKKIAPATYILPKEGNMLVPGLIIATKKLLQEMEIERPLEQVKNVACLPGITGYSIAMPDIHWGYGFAIGGVAAMDEEGVVSPGGVGYDINCGVRLALVPELYQNLNDHQKNVLLKCLFNLIPSGIGGGHKGAKGLVESDYKEIIEKGARFSVEHGYGFERDLEYIESNGVIENADIKAISQHAKDRGAKQLGSIGSGNHFVEVGEIQEIIQPDIANAWNVKKGQIYVLIHSGSRGFGHQICQDTLDKFMKKGYADNLPDKQLVSAPIKSDDGQLYLTAMAGAANYAFNNRQQILHLVRQGFKDVLQIKPEEIKLLYDVCHNIAKFEEYEINGKKQRVCVHRKGATRAYGKGAEELGPIFKETGQPVLVPGDMGRASFLLQGLGNPITWNTCCHGAGRARSRVKSKKAWKGRDPLAYMHKQDVDVIASSMRTIVEEMPDAYKDVSDVVEAVQKAKLANIVAKLKPHLVVKG